MKKPTMIGLALSVALLVAGCGNRQPKTDEVEVESAPAPHTTLVPDEKHASLTMRNVGGEGDNPVFYFMGSPDTGDEYLGSAGERVYDQAYLKKIPRYLIRMAGGTDVIDKLVDADKPIKVRAVVQEQKIHINGLPGLPGLAFGGKKQPASQTFTPKNHSTYLVETVVADSYALRIYELSPSGAKTLVNAQ